MFAFWLILGGIMILAGIFNKQLLHAFSLKPLSEVFTTPRLKHSSRWIEQAGQWFVIVLGIGFLVQGLGAALPDEVAHTLSLVLLGVSALLLLAIFGIAMVNWTKS